MGAWTLEVDRLEESPAQFELGASAEWWEEARATLREPEVPMHRPLRLDFQGHRLGLRLLFRGGLSGSVDLVCTRCLDRYEERFDEPFQLLLEPAGQASEVPESGIALDADDLELGRYAGDELDFGAAVLEILALAWPMQPRCKDSCAGLCPSCGTNLNAERCGCDTASTTRPFAGLGDLIERARRRES